MHHRATALFAGTFASALFLNAGPARAIFHTWDISEVYSNDDGSVQFIEFEETQDFDGQHFLSFGTLTTDANAFPFTDLGSGETANKFFLVGTAAYAASAGAVAPDFVVPAQFFSVDGDTITFFPSPAGPVDAVTFTAADLPTNGLLSMSIERSPLPADEALPGPAAVNSPTNFAGEVGLVVPAGEFGLFAVLDAAQAGGGGRTGSGAGIFTVDTVAGTLSFQVAYEGLSDDEIPSHLHGPSLPGVPAAVVYPLPLGDLKLGSIDLVDLQAGAYPVADQIQDLLAGLWYANVHSIPFGGGEIRGQLTVLAYCFDGLDNDLDGLTDFPDDPGCRGSGSIREDPQCDDGVDNDGDSLVDLADPGCLGQSWVAREQHGCGVGGELALVLPTLIWLTVKRRAARR